MTSTADTTLTTEIEKSSAEEINNHSEVASWFFAAMIVSGIIAALWELDPATTFQRTFRAEEFTKYHCARGTPESEKALGIDGAYTSLAKFCKNYFSLD